MPTVEPIIKELETIAFEGGATAVKQIHPQDVVVARWVRNKCQFGCELFGKRFSCPPYAPTPEETAVALQSYQKALLVEFGNRTIEQIRIEPTRSLVHRVIFRMERAAFLSGLERTFSYPAGPCTLCQECPAEKLETCNLFCKKECRFPREVRPSMEGAGVDVYSTVRRAGFEIHVLREQDETFKEFGLVLLE